MLDIMFSIPSLLGGIFDQSWDVVVGSGLGRIRVKFGIQSNYQLGMEDCSSHITWRNT